MNLFVMTYKFFVREIHISPLDSHHKGPVMQHYDVSFILARKVAEEGIKAPVIWKASRNRIGHGNNEVKSYDVTSLLPWPIRCLEAFLSKLLCHLSPASIADPWQQTFNLLMVCHRDITQCIEAEIKFPPFCRLKFQIHFFNEKFVLWLKFHWNFFLMEQLMITLIQVMAWCWSDNKPLIEAMTTLSTYA